MPTSSAPSEAGAPSQALVPALETTTSWKPSSAATRVAITSASALRHVFPVQTNSTRTSVVSDEVAHTLTQRRGGDRARPDHARTAGRAIHHRGGGRGLERSAVEQADPPVGDLRAPVRQNVGGTPRGRESRKVRARGSERVTHRRD